MIRITYWLGWLCFAAALIFRVGTYLGFGPRMVTMSVLPRNLLALSFLFFLICLATEAVGRAGQK